MIDANEMAEVTTTDPDTTIDRDTTTDLRGITRLGMLPLETLPEVVTMTGEAVVDTTDRDTERIRKHRKCRQFSSENGNPCVGASGRVLAFLKHVCIH